MCWTGDEENVPASAEETKISDDYTGDEKPVRRRPISISILTTLVMAYQCGGD
jgi:hypothetical protein